jgi:hypothetical protein
LPQLAQSARKTHDRDPQQITTVSVIIRSAPSVTTGRILLWRRTCKR